ncbi:MAG: hypothetical protein A3G20_03300 [Acidobacteria bacterium RIFCSPLOWO2_12_FULL_59_11]|nr:MAG: hypothetical protein A3G20_03300 [Acidobacteria bacterium RIFCSPLOWO2_12_FULL_59_11]
MVSRSEFFLLYSIYTAIMERELGHGVSLPSYVEEELAGVSSAPEQAVQETAEQWLALLSLSVTPYRLRNYIKEQDIDEPTLRALIRFLAGKKTHVHTDRDKVDWLTTYLFKKREERQGKPIGWPKIEMQEILQGFEFPPLKQYAADLLMEFPSLLDEAGYFESFSQITESRIIPRARDLKNQFGEDFFHPEVLAAIINYNLLFGKKFHKLLEEVMAKVHEFAHAQSGGTATDTNELLQRDYRATTDTFQQLGELERKEETATAQASNLGKLKDQQLKELGIDSMREAQGLQGRVQELSMRLKSNQGMTSIPNTFAPLSLHEWESSAFRTQLPESEQSFRADFTRSVCHAIAIISRIYEEIPLYHEKKGTEFLWKKHYDSLVYLLYEGRKHKESLLRVAILSQQRGLLEKAKQLQLTAEKLDAVLAKLAALF